jgi:uncharacterized membrane protein (UPF0127 family)
MIIGQVRDETDTCLPLKVRKTSSMLERMRGLLFAPVLASNEGLWIEPCNSIHTFFMRFPIDVVFLDQSGTVVKVVENIPAWRLAGSFGAVAVIELLAGVARSLGIKRGRQYHWVSS